VLVLFGSAMMVRAASRAEGRAAMERGLQAGVDPDALPSDAASLAKMIQNEVERVVAEVQSLPSEHEQLALIVDRLGEVQKTLVPAFAAARQRATHQPRVVRGGRRSRGRGADVAARCR
jgi:hypothetical protein